MKQQSVAAVAVLVLLEMLSACGGPQHSVREQGTVLDAVATGPTPSPGKALLVASLTAENLDFHRRALIALPIYAARNAKAAPIVLRISNGLPRPDSGRQSDFADVQGKLFSIELKPGDYQLWPWLAYDSEYFVSPGRTEYWTFSLKEGEVLYLGNFHFGLIQGSHLFSQPGGAPNLKSVRFELREQYDRDAQVLARRYPGLDLGAINRGGPKDLPWGRVAQMNESLKGLSPLDILGGFRFYGLGGVGSFGGSLSGMDMLVLTAALGLALGLRRRKPAPATA